MGHLRIGEDHPRVEPDVVRTVIKNNKAAKEFETP